MQFINNLRKVHLSSYFNIIESQLYYLFNSFKLNYIFPRECFLWRRQAFQWKLKYKHWFSICTIKLYTWYILVDDKTNRSIYIWDSICYLLSLQSLLRTHIRNKLLFWADFSILNWKLSMQARMSPTYTSFNTGTLSTFTKITNWL